MSLSTRAKASSAVIRYAFEYCKKAQTRAQKAHPLRQDERADLCLRSLGADVPRSGREGISRISSADYAHVDATTMWFVKNPEWFDVIVTDNMFGDIITDLGAMIQGGMGIAAGGNINPAGRFDVRADRRLCARNITGKNVINPLAAICAAGR